MMFLTTITQVRYDIFSGVVLSCCCYDSVFVRWWLSFSWSHWNDVILHGNAGRGI